MPRFAILNHDYPFQHWDLLLENGPSCRTWRLLRNPEQTSTELPAESLPDHRLLYLDYSGPVSGDRGRVIPWDQGTCEWRVNQPDFCELVVAGEHWKGRLRLRQDQGSRWNLALTGLHDDDNIPG